MDWVQGKSLTPCTQFVCKIMKLEFRKCEICPKLFKVSSWYVKRNWGRFCSLTCKGVSQKGKTPWNKGKLMPSLVGNKHREGKTPWNKGVILAGYSRMGFRKENRFYEDPRVKATQFKKGVAVSPKTQFKKGQNTGLSNPQWKGGVTPESKLVRTSPEMTEWRRAVFARDSYTCQWCKQRGGRLIADHIKMFHFYPTLRFSVDNGQTLCESCNRWKNRMDMKLYHAWT